MVPEKDSEILPGANSTKDEMSIRHGKWIAYSERGEKTAEGSYLEGEMNGKWQFWQPGGIMLAQEQNYKNGVLHGVSASYDKSGKKISEAHYKEGMFHGDYKVWNDKGTLVQHLVYKEGRKVKDVLNKKNF